MVDFFKAMSENSWIIEIVSAVLGVVFTTLIGTVAYFYKRTEAKRDQEVSSLRANIKEIATNSAQAHKELFKSLAGVKDAVMQFRGELRLTHNQLDITTNGMTKMEGKIEMLAASVAQNTNELIRANSKLEAVFRVVDAPRRRSDVQG